MSIYISYSEGEETQFVHFVRRLTIGRSSKNDIKILDLFSSATHCEIRDENGYLIIKDLGSKNGCYVNSHRVEEAHFFIGDVLQIGDVKIQIDSSRLNKEEREILTFKDIRMLKARERKFKKELEEEEEAEQNEPKGWKKLFGFGKK